MKNCNIVLLVLAIFFLNSCSKDLGTDLADYRDINEVSIEGIDKNYARDMDDSLKIEPKVLGTMYSDTSKFNYSWDINNTIVSTSLNLNIRVDMIPGNKISRFIVEDKTTRVKKYFRFDLNVSSSTAGGN